MATFPLRAGEVVPRRAPSPRWSLEALRDAAVYAGSALYALGTMFVASIPIHRSWARMAVGPYAAGALLAVVLARRPGVRARALLLAAVVVGSLAVPLGLEVAWRTRSGPATHAQSEVLVTEEAARALLRGQSPYQADFESGPLATRPPGTRTHFPYLPAMALFGLPRALGGAHAWTDARVAFALATLALLWLSVAAAGLAPGPRLAAVQAMLAIPTGALLLATGGDDLPVIALMVLAVVLAARGRPVGAGVALGVAAATKQFSWLLVPFLLAGTAAGRGRRDAARMALGAAAVAVPLVAGFAAWTPGAFLEDAVRFPLGLGTQQTPAATPNLGSALVRALPWARLPVTVALVAAVLVSAALALLRRPPRTVSRAARSAGLVVLAAVVLAPAARIGYLVYPINLLVWSWLLGEDRQLPGPGLLVPLGVHRHPDRPDHLPA